MWLWAVGDGGRRSWASQPSAESQPLQADSGDRSWQFRLSRKNCLAFFSFFFFFFSHETQHLYTRRARSGSELVPRQTQQKHQNISPFVFFLLNTTVRSLQMIKNTQIASTNSINAVVVSHRNRAQMQSVPFALPVLYFSPLQTMIFQNWSRRQ